MTFSVTAAGRTHAGLVRKRNEDALYLGESLFAVADGLGGHPAGDIASATVVEALRAHDRSVETSDLAASLARTVRATNDALGQKIEVDAALAGMGTTLVALLRSGNTAVLANVGDSRAYLHRNGRTTPLTEDHTFAHLVSDAADAPNLSASMTRWLDGRPDSRSPDLTTHALRPGDRFLLCTDGLSSYVAFEAIDAALRSRKELGSTVDQLIDLAFDNGGPDNITVTVIDVHG